MSKQTRSSIIVQHMMEKNSAVKRTGFNKALIKALSGKVDDEDLDYVKEFLGRVPDAYLINEAEKEIVWFEVEDTHRLKNDKINSLYHLWFALDYCYWNIGFISINRYGTATPLNIYELGVPLAYGNSEQAGNREPERL